MLLEGEVEIRIKDRTTQLLEEHDLKLWVQRSFKNMCCYRISALRREPDKSVRAQVALKVSDLPDAERQQIESRPQDVALLKACLERMFEGKGTCRSIGEPKIKKS